MSTPDRPRPRTRLFSAASLALLCGFLPLMTSCGSSEGSKKFVDPVYHFQFRMPSNWQAPSRGSNIQTQGGPGYSLDFTKPQGLRVLIQGRIRGLTGFQSPKVVVNANSGCSIKCTYYIVKISGRPGVLIVQQDRTKNLVDGETAVVNSAKWSYSIEIRSPTNVAGSELAGYREMVRTFRTAKGY